MQNFELAALLGAVYAVFAFFAGRFAQRAGYFASVQLGLGIMVAAILLTSRMTAAWPAVALLAVATIGMCFTWPALEGLMSEGETRARLRGLVGIYNCTWAVTGAFAYFTGGAMQKSLGRQSLFFVPAGLLFAGDDFFILAGEARSTASRRRRRTTPPAAGACRRSAAPLRCLPALFSKWAGWPIRWPTWPSILLLPPFPPWPAIQSQ